MKYGPIFTLLSCFLMFTTASAQPPVSWEATHDGPGQLHDEVARVAIDASGAVYVAGTTGSAAGFEDMIVVRYSPAGVFLWQDVFSGPPGVFDSLSDMVVTEAAVHVVGTSNSIAGRFIVTRKYDLNGLLLWHDAFPVLNAAAFSRPAVIAVTSDDSVVVGASDSGDLRIIRYTASGSLAWTQMYDGPFGGEDGFFDLGVDSTGAVLVTGILGPAGEGTVVAKYDAGGQFLWEHQILGAFGGVVSPSRLRVSEDDRVVVTSGHETLCGLFEYRTVQLAPNGMLEWEVDYHGPLPCDASDPLGNVITSDGTVVVTGSGVTATTTGFRDVVTLAYAPNGDHLWTHGVDLPGSIVDLASAIAVGNDGPTDGDWAVYVTAVSVSGTVSDSSLMRYEPDGSLSWSVELVGPNGILFEGEALAVRGRRIAVAGKTVAPSGFTDLLVQVFDLPAQFVRADCNADAALDVGDAITALGALFGGAPVAACADACDSNDDGVFDLADPIATLSHLFSGAPPPAAPYPACGVDPTPDALTCSTQASACP